MIPPAPNPPKADHPTPCGVAGGDPPSKGRRPPPGGGADKGWDQPERPDVQYLPRDCPFLKKEVWAIVTKQGDGTWRIVNCLDKREPCFKHNCAFTVDGGQWPFEDVTVDNFRSKGKP